MCRAISCLEQRSCDVSSCQVCLQLSQRFGMQVPAAHIERLDITPDIDAAAVAVVVLGSKAAEGAVAHVTVLDAHGKEVTAGTCTTWLRVAGQGRHLVLSNSVEVNAGSKTCDQHLLPGWVCISKLARMLLSLL